MVYLDTRFSYVILISSKISPFLNLIEIINFIDCHFKILLLYGGKIILTDIQFQNNNLIMSRLSDTDAQSN